MTTLITLILLSGIACNIYIFNKLFLYVDIASVMLHTTPKVIWAKAFKSLCHK